MNNTETRTYVYTSDEKDKAEKRKLRSVIMIAAGVLLLVVGVLLIVLAPALSDSKNIMPDVIGFDRDKAIAQLEKRGLEVDVIEVESDEYEAGVVIDQSIKPGEEIEPGMFVKLTISAGNGGSASVFGSAPPMESADPDSADTDGLERGKGGGSSGNSGGGSSGSSGGSKPTQTPTPTKTPSVIPTPKPTESQQPSGQPSGEPSGQPSVEPSGQPSGEPSGQPSGEPSGQPSGEPSGQPSGEPSGQPSGQPSGEPSGQPSESGDSLIGTDLGDSDSDTGDGDGKK